jgi:hypothetical protein
VNTLQDVSLLQSPNTLILLHLPHTDLVLQLDQFVLQAVKVILMPPVSTHLSLYGLITEGLDAQVHLVLIRVPSAEEPHVSYGVMRALTEVKKGGGVEVVGVWSGAAGMETVDCGVVRELHFCEFGRPDTSIWPPNGHWHELRT